MSASTSLAKYEVSTYSTYILVQPETPPDASAHGLLTRVCRVDTGLSCSVCGVWNVRWKLVPALLGRWNR